MVSKAGAAVLTVFLLLIAGVLGYIGFTQWRAKRLGLPAPSLSSYIPWRKSESAYGPPQPAAGGIVGWFNDQVRKFKNRNNRSAAGAYEPSGGGPPRGTRGFGPLDPDEAWDTRVGHEADIYYEEQELGARRTDYGGSGGAGGAFRSGPADYDAEERGRPTSRPAERGGPVPPAHKNPFDDDAQVSLRGVSPRPIGAVVERPGSAGSHAERKSMFREEM